MKEIIKNKVIIIGSGPAGYTAAIYAARACLDPLLISGNSPGGQLILTPQIENFPGAMSYGDTDILSGDQLMEVMRKQAQNAGTRIINQSVTEVDLRIAPFSLKTDDGQYYKTDSLIIATGAQAKWLGLDSEKYYQGYGVSACATCDGFFFRNKIVAVIGGGNTAAEEAIHLTKYADQVYIIHRRGELKADATNIKNVLSNPKIKPIWNTSIEEIIGEENPRRIVSIKIKNILNNQLESLNIDGLFIAIGHKPSSEIFKGQIPLDNDGYIITAPDSTKTMIDGVFAAGDVRDKLFRQAVTAAGTGCMAALEAEKFLHNKN